MFPKNNKGQYDPDQTYPQVYYYTGPPGPPGPFGPPGKPGNLNDTAAGFVYAQLAHVLKQIILYYPSTIMRAYGNGFTFAGLEGIPIELFSSSEGTYGGLFVVEEEGERGAIPLQSIASVTYTGGVVYNPTITFIPKPFFPAGFDTNIVTAIHDYLPLLTPVTVYMGTVIDVSGIVYKNEYGMLVVADDALGTNPSFIPVTNITGIVPTVAASSSVSSAGKSRLVISYKS
jgi:hypothetical protein